MRGLRFDHQPVERYGVAAPAADAKALVPEATQGQAHLIDAARKGAVQARVVKIEGAGHNDLQEFDNYLKAFFGALPG